MKYTHKSGKYCKMSDKRLMRPTRAMLATICICSCLIQTSTAAPLPQNFFSEAAAGSLGVASHVAELLQNGVAARRDFGIQIPGFGMHSKSEIGMGQAVVHRIDSSSSSSSSSSEEESDERRRRRRRSPDSDDDHAAGVTDEDDFVTGPKTSFKKMLRNMHAPCHMGTGGGGTGGTGGTGGDTGGGDGGEEIIEEARRRMARMRARKAAQARKAKKSTTKSKKTQNGRKRRQTEIEDLAGMSESEQAEWREKWAAHWREFSEKMGRVYENIAVAMMDMMKRVGGKFDGDE